ncbi:MAG TPA: DUF424 family protein [Nitrososphaeraceae archaeon]|jgi:uncharacterized protein|nr:DUF424 family protein [Nitrososphaeraceae archaeon]
MKSMRGDNQIYAARTTRYSDSLMISVCDADLVGKTLTQGEMVISLSGDYFQEEVIEKEEAADLLNKCSIANLVGEKIVAMAISMGLAKEASVKRICGIPFLMIFKFYHR